MQEAGTPPTRQRVGAYAVVLRDDDEILLAKLAPRIRPDCWTLPGGGIDHGEHPRDALLREVHEETGLHVGTGRILDVYSTHFTGARPDGLVEDYHGLGLIFEAHVLPESEDVQPHVVEVDGSTEEAAWVPLRLAAALGLTGVAHHALGLLGTEARR